MKNYLKKLTTQPTSASRRVAKNTGISYARMGITMFISLYTTRLILNSLGASDFGIFAIVGGAIAMLGFLNGAMTNATQRFMSYAAGERNKEKQKNIFNVSIILHFLIAIIMAIVLLIAGHFFFNGILNIPVERIFAARMVYYFMIASTVFTIMTVPYDAVIYAHENMFYYAIVRIIESIFKLGVAIAVVYTSADKLIVYGLLMACISFWVMIVMRVYCYKKYDECTIAPKVYYKHSLMKEMTGYAGWNLLGTSSTMFMYYGQNIIINMFFGTKVNAAQGVATQVNGQLCALAQTMMSALYPVIVKSEGAGDRKLLFKAVNFGSKISFFLLALPFIPVMIEMPYIFNFWLKNVPEYTIIFCRLLLIKSLIEFLFNPVANTISAHGNIKKYEIISSLFCFLPLIIVYLLFKAGFPAYCLYVIYVVYSITASGIGLYFAWKNVGFPVLLFLRKTFLRCFCSYLIIFTVSFIPIFLSDESFYRLLSVTVISVIALVLTAWFLGLTGDEKIQIERLCAPYIAKLSAIKMKIWQKSN